jgi:hypothetical protein
VEEGSLQARALWVLGLAKCSLFPPGMNDLCVVSVSCSDEQDSADVVRLTDERVTWLMRLVPVREGDAEGAQP